MDTRSIDSCRPQSASAAASMAGARGVFGRQRRWMIIALAACLSGTPALAGAALSLSQSTVYPYLEDGDFTEPPPKAAWPQINMTDSSSFDSPLDRYSKYDLIGTKGFMAKAITIKKAYPEQMVATRARRRDMARNNARRLIVTRRVSCLGRRG